MAKRAELHARGLRDAHIAEQMGIKRAYFSQIVNGLNISDMVVDKMCSSFSLTFINPEQVANSQTPAIGPDKVILDKSVWEDLVSNQKTLIQLMHRMLDEQQKGKAK